MSDDEFDEPVGSSIMLGTPLEPLSEDVVPRKKPIPLEEQIVTDENGRRRFHGAFTGGFSAGFFNTAGSRDGWSPAHFKSSRSQRKETRQQKPVDFMDDEDLGEFGIAPQGLRTASQFRNVKKDEESRKRKIEELEQMSGPIPGEPVLNQFMKPSTDTIGITLLRNMGWKPGQGIGPRLSRRQKSSQKSANKRMFTVKSDQKRKDGDDEEDFIDPKYKDFLFAPDDIPDFVMTPKDNLFGIGYSGLDRSSVLSSGHINLFEPSLKVKDKQNKMVKFRGQAFGVGAYEEEDEDIYGRDDMSKYDFELTPAGVEQRKASRKSRWNEIEEETNKIIEGFQRASLESRVRKHFPPPILPKNFVPRSGVRKSRFDPDPNETKLATSNPTPEQRQQALALPKDLVEAKPKVVTQSDEQLTKLLSSGVKETAAKMTSFQPFSRDPEKQNRYEKYLVCLKNKRQDALPLLQPKDMTDWERERERVEFERASMLYRPLAGGMGSKFVSAGSSEDVGNILDKVKTTDEDLEDKDARNAARMKMFGKLTREKEEWHPANVLCIRFNVKNPYSDHSVVGVRKKMAGKFELFKVPEEVMPVQEVAVKEEPIPVDPITPSTSSGSSNVSSSETSKVVAIPDPGPEKPKPSMDLFKSIFLSDDEEDESDNEKEQVKEEEAKKEAPAKSNVFKNKMAPTGIFANVDFDALNKKKSKPTVEIKPDPKPVMTTKVKTPVQDPEGDHSFGPALPSTATAPAPIPDHDHDSEDSASEWTEKKPKKSSKKSKKAKKKKAKSKAKKAKKKSKKRRRHSSSSGDSTSSSD